VNYVSTRGAWRETPQPFLSILLEGLAPDGGLAVPERYPAFAAGELDALAGAPYRTVAYAVLSKFVGDIPGTDLRAIVDRTYTAAAFGSDAIVADLARPLGLLRASNGPTLAFKDIALQLLGELFEYALARDGRRITILGATSGDTGSSAEVAMRGRKGIDVFMLSPHGRMSPFQTAQMFAIDDANIHNLAVDGTFDDCQDLVKAVAGDTAFKRRYAIGAVLDQLGPHRARSSLRPRLFAARTGPARRSTWPAARANSGNICPHVPTHGRAAAAADPRDQRERRARRVLPHRPLPPRGASERAQRRSVDDISKASNFERYITTSSAAIPRPCALFVLERTAVSTCTAPRLGPRCRRRASSRAKAATPIASRRSGTSSAATVSSSTRTRPTGSRSGSRIATRRFRSSASRPRCPRSSPRLSERPLAATPRGRRHSKVSSRGPSIAPHHARSDVVRSFIATHVPAVSDA
jgi:hypothetical protein